MKRSFKELTELLPADFNWSDPLRPDILDDILNAYDDQPAPSASFTYKGADGNYLDTGPWHVSNDDTGVVSFAPIYRDGQVVALVVYAGFDDGTIAVDENCRLLAGNANAATQAAVHRPELAVWYGSMPETNGKSNFTAVLHRKTAEGFDMFTDGFTIARSEYPDRVRYAADCVRYLIGDLPEKPWITDYDGDKHSGYRAPKET